MRTKFDSELEALNIELIKMGALCEEALASAVKALFQKDEALIVKTSALEKEIDSKERDIETLCMRLLLKQQPVAHDLLTVSSALRMISDMERIGDQAEDIAELAKTIGSAEIVNEEHMHAMAESAAEMVRGCVDSFVKADLKMAKDVIERDDVVDDLFQKVKYDLVEKMSEPECDFESCLDALMAAKYLERIGDHATNIAEWVEYSLTGSKK
ncbi:MAG: phosphate signaling complex protein PhoU [Clostridia bacterium]|nr:phosphate signaling complex protein PhoU [Clostridia bacterium]